MMHVRRAHCVLSRGGLFKNALEFRADQEICRLIPRSPVSGLQRLCQITTHITGRGPDDFHLKIGQTSAFRCICLLFGRWTIRAQQQIGMVCQLCQRT